MITFAFEIFLETKPYKEFSFINILDPKFTIYRNLTRNYYGNFCNYGNQRQHFCTPI